MRWLARILDWLERQSYLKAYLETTQGNFESKLRETEREVRAQRKAEIQASAVAEESVEIEVERAIQLLSDKYRPDLIFDDVEFFGFKPNFSTQEFLERKRCFLKDWRDEAGQLASDIIWSACKLHGLDQRIILMSLQREQSALSAKKPLSDRKMKRILGYGCLDAKDKNSKPVDLVKYYGFRKQIESAARRYVQLANQWVQGTSIRIDFRNGSVIPLNGPTWAMYRYTPHTHAGKVSFLIAKSNFGVSYN